MGLQPQRIEVDPFGSYTGVPDDPEETPVQDADDLWEGRAAARPSSSFDLLVFFSGGQPTTNVALRLVLI